MSVAIWTVLLMPNSHLVSVTKPAPTGDSTHQDELLSQKRGIALDNGYEILYARNQVYRSVSLWVYESMGPRPIDLWTY